VRVAPEDVGEGRGDHDLEAVLEQGPGRVLAGRAAAEVAAGEKDLRAGVGRVVELEARTGVAVLVEPPVEEEVLPEAGARDALEELLRDDLVGVHVGAVEHRDAGRGLPERLHQTRAASRSRTSTKCPSIAAAAAVAGLTRWVRPPRPWRPSKLRF